MNIRLKIHQTVASFSFLIFCISTLVGLWLFSELESELSSDWSESSSELFSLGFCFYYYSYSCYSFYDVTVLYFDDSLFLCIFDSFYSDEELAGDTSSWFDSSLFYEIFSFISNIFLLCYSLSVSNFFWIF